MSKSYYFLNLGCPKNQTDGDFVRGALNDLGLVEKDLPGDSDYILINTCAFIEDARLETEGELRILQELKSDHTKIIALGCYPALPGYEQGMLDVDAAFKFSEVEQLLKYVSGDTDYCLDPGKITRVVSGLPYAYLVISDGCDNRCSYCSIPNIRGRYRSRSVEKLVNEAEYLSANGVKELVLVAQDTSIYGKDLPGDIDLSRLCEMLSEIDGIEWLRLMYLHPAHTDEQMLERLFAIKKVCRYIDMPIQHISDKILKSMGRRYNGDRVWRLINHLRKLDKNISLRTTLMVGFPGETDEDYGMLLDFVESARLDYIGAFAYSPERSTKAGDMPDRVEDELAGQRLDHLYTISEEVSLEKAQAKIGLMEEMLIEDVSEEYEGCFEARFSGQAPEIDGIYNLEMKTGAGIGDIITAKITDVDKAEIV